MSNTLFLSAALLYAARGWRVLPCHPRGKKPLIAAWPEKATTDEATIREWWERWPDANIGVATGWQSGFFVLDIDVGEGKKGAESLDALEAEHGGLPTTVEAVTGSGGRHLFFAMPEGRTIGNGTNIRPGIDVRGERGYVIIAPSTHPETGQPYKLIDSTRGTARPWESEPPSKPRLIAPAPEWLLELISPAERAESAVPPPAPAAAPLPRDKPAPLTPSRTDSTAPTSLSVEERARAYLRECDPAVQGQSGHDKLLWACRAMVIGFELDKKTAAALLLSEYNPRCNPPWNVNSPAEMKEFHRKIDEALRTPGSRPRGWLKDETDGIRADQASIDHGQQIVDAMLASHRRKSALAALETQSAKSTQLAPSQRREPPTGVQVAESGAPWTRITDAQARQAIKGTALESLVQEFEAVTRPPLPLQATLPKALVLVGCALSQERSEPRMAGEKGIDRARLVINTASGQVANFYALLVAESGTGKDIGGRLGRHASRELWHVGSAASAEGLADALIAVPNGLFEIAEFQNYLDPKHWQGKSTTFLTSAFSQGWFKDALSSRNGRVPPRESVFCFPNIIANVQPGVLRQCASQLHIESGLMGRFIVAVMDDSDRRPATADLTDLAANSRAALDCFKAKKGVIYVPENYLQTVYDLFSKNAAPFRPHWKRLVNEYGPRLALALSVKKGDCTETALITSDGWLRAEVLIQWFYTQASRALGAIGGDARTIRLEMIMNRIHRYIHRHGGVTVADISRNCGKGTSAKERAEALHELLDRGLIAQVDHGNSRFVSLHEPENV